MKLSYLCIFFILLLSGMTVIAQDEPPAPQFLLRQDNQLLLIDGYTGDVISLPIELAERDTVKWSSNGTYLVVEADLEDTIYTCINLYDVDTSEWISLESIACEVKDWVILADDSQLFYIIEDEQMAILWLFEIGSKSTRKLYETRKGDTINDVGLSSLELSPNQRHLSMREYDYILGGTLNYLLVMNLETYTHFEVVAPDPYYADYTPIWSSDELWFLIKLKDEYITTAAFPPTNHKGDVYLINAESGEQYRITYTPAVEERNIHWTDDGEIAFTEVIMNDVTITLEDAQNIEPIPREDIVQPDEVEFPNRGKGWIVYSADPTISAWYGSDTDDNGNRTYSLTIGTFQPENIVFTATSTEELQTDAVAIGWRPTDFVYSQE